MNKNNIRKIKTNKIAQYSSLSFSFVLIALFILLVTFILIMAIGGFQNFGFQNILFSSNFDPSKNQYSFWVPFSATIITSALALCLSIPIGIRVAIFTKYRLHKRFRKYVLVMFQTLSGVPSVIFGLFAANSLGTLFQTLFGISPYSIFNGSIMLVFMVIPTVVAMVLDSLNGIDDSLLNNSLALGNTKSRSIYKVCKKAAKSGIMVAIIIALSKAISESMAVSMILQATPSEAMFENGFFGFLNSSSQTLGAYISTAMFADTDPDKIRPLLYSFGFIMLIFSMILNSVILVMSRKKNNKPNSKFRKFELLVEEYLMFLPRQVKMLCEKLFFRSKTKLNAADPDSAIQYVKERNNDYKFYWLYPSWKLCLETLSILVCSGFLFWIIGDVVVNGIIGTSNNPTTFFVYSKNSISQSLVNTLLIILVCLVIGFPIALMCSIFLNEYSKDGKLKKTIIFFLDSLGSTPSIIFGMFGLLLFIQTLGLTSVGSLGNSLIAGALTLIIVILPSFIRMLEQALKNVPMDIRTNAYALGSTKWETIRKLVLPMAFISITSSIITITGRIFSETAPLYLTAGLSSSNVTALDRPGTTLTTHIYAQIFSSNPNALEIQYQAAMLTLIIVLSLVLVGYILVPNRKLIKQKIINSYNYIRSWIKDDQPKGATNEI